MLKSSRLPGPVAELTRFDSEVGQAVHVYEAGMKHGRTRRRASFERLPHAVPEAARNTGTVEAALAAAMRHYQAGRPQQAAALYRKVLAAHPDHPTALHLLGVVMHQVGKSELAVDLIGKAIALEPDHVKAHYNLGNALKSQGKLEDAVASYRKAVALKPDFVEAHANLGYALQRQDKFDEAVAAYRKAIALKPDFVEVHANLGYALQRQDKFDEAVAAYRKAIELKPDFAEVYANLGDALSAQGRLEEAVALFRKALELKPDFAGAHSNLLKHLHYIPGLTLDEIFAEHRRWNAQHAAPLAGEIRPHTNDRDPDRRLRVGLVSGCFKRHPVTYVITPAVEAPDRAVWELYIYSNGGRPDHVTEWFRAAADAWREIGGMEDSAVAQLIRDDRIDILVDLSGHAGRNRLLVLARKPAPVQVKWVEGEFNTTGMDAMDYFLSDAVETPPGAEKLFTEEVIRLPDGYACYAPPEYAPEVGPLPALSKGYVTFGCFNKVAKVNEGVVALWSRLLQDLPDARLVLKTKSLGDASVRERYHAMFETHGIERQRVDLLARSPHAELLAHYNAIDIALDPFPYSGCLTTYEALWMGVPVVSLPGETFAGRHSASHLHNVGLGGWVVATAEEYLAVAERWSRDGAALADLRAGLRGRMAASPLCDGPRFARNLEAAFRAMWRRWCEAPATPSLSGDG